MNVRAGCSHFWGQGTASAFGKEFLPFTGKRRIWLSRALKSLHEKAIFHKSEDFSAETRGSDFFRENQEFFEATKKI